MHHAWLPDRLDIEANGLAEDVVATLKSMGHNVRLAGRQGSA